MEDMADEALPADAPERDGSPLPRAAGWWAALAGVLVGGAGLGASLAAT